MQFAIESEGGRQHWIVKCIDKGKLVELHRFYRLGEYLYSRGKHGEHELVARNALLDYFKQHVGEIPEVPACERVSVKRR